MSFPHRLTLILSMAKDLYDPSETVIPHQLMVPLIESLNFKKAIF